VPKTRRPPSPTPWLGTDAELLGLVANAHREALGQLYLRHARAVRSAAFRITHDANEAEDLVHDVFLEVWRAAGEYEPARGSVRAWLLVRARSRSLDRRRRLKRSLSEELFYPPNSCTAPPEAEDLTLRSAVNRLPAALRELLELGYYAGMSSTEMATALAIPLGTVKSRVARALAELRAMLGEDSEPQHL
jgi:RNA polymerase sigma-70 factor (ECF subfamily)